MPRARSAFQDGDALVSSMRRFVRRCYNPKQKIQALFENSEDQDIFRDRQAPEADLQRTRHGRACSSVQVRNIPRSCGGFIGRRTRNNVLCSPMIGCLVPGSRKRLICSKIAQLPTQKYRASARRMRASSGGCYFRDGCVWTNTCRRALRCENTANEFIDR